MHLVGTVFICFYVGFSPIFMTFEQAKMDEIFDETMIDLLDNDDDDDDDDSYNDVGKIRSDGSLLV